MLRLLKFTARAVPWLAVTAVLCWVTVPGAASAQTARNLDCNKCVDTKEIKKKAVTRSRLKNNAVNFRKLHGTVEDAIKQDRTFYVTLDSTGAEATLVSQGPLRIFVRCFVDDDGNDRLEIVYSSTASGWLIMFDAAPRAAGEEVLESVSVPTGTTDTEGSTLVGAIAPDGSTIGHLSRIGIGFNVFGHVCLAFGSATGFTGSP